MEYVFHATLFLGPYLLLLLHAALFTDDVAASIRAMIRSGWARGQAVLYRTWATIAATLLVSPRPGLV